MHHFILVKIKADNRQDAFDEAKSQLETSISPENNTAGWDYLADDHAVADKKYLIQHEQRFRGSGETLASYEEPRRIAC